MEGSAKLVEAIEAPLNYMTKSGETPFSYTYEPPPGMPARSGEIDQRQATIRNGRAVSAQLSLDKEGFRLGRAPTQVRNFYDEAEVKRIYYPEVEALLRAATGAAKVVIFDHTVRNTAPEKQSGREVRGAAGRVHNDYTEDSAPQRVRDLLPPEEAEARLQRRYAEINLWRPIPVR